MRKVLAAEKREHVSRLAQLTADKRNVALRECQLKLKEKEFESAVADQFRELEEAEDETGTST